ncbi:hypothetical protein HHI36_011725 [Cryptolaemus montrouzieri]|uniref:Uncharacterized protein n=1 Tax=Cryptolaemus montrouzieri TaxID=559131 RepID=A0ABD2NC75_9CUCU
MSYFCRFREVSLLRVARVPNTILETARTSATVKYIERVEVTAYRYFQVELNKVPTHFAWEALHLSFSFFSTYLELLRLPGDIKGYLGILGYSYFISVITISVIHTLVRNNRRNSIGLQQSCKQKHLFGICVAIDVLN